jgi:hypothetical protein
MINFIELFTKNFKIKSIMPNFLILGLSALIPMIVGFLWYGKSLFGKAWMKETGLTEEKIKSGNMALTMGLSLLFCFFIAFNMHGIVIHQAGIFSLLMNDPEFFTVGSESYNIYHYFDGMHQSFGHGVLHGGMTGLLFAGAVITVNSLFEMRSFKYIAIHVGYWVVSLALMGGVIAQFS